MMALIERARNWGLGREEAISTRRICSATSFRPWLNITTWSRPICRVLAVKQLNGTTKIVAASVLGSPNGRPAFHRIAEVHLPSMQALEACAASQGGKETLASAIAISSGGPPIVLIAEEETFEF